MISGVSTTNVRPEQENKPIHAEKKSYMYSIPIIKFMINVYFFLIKKHE